MMIKLKIASSAVFTRPQNGAARLPSLLPLRLQITQLLRKLRDAKVEIRPFTIEVGSEAARDGVRTTFFMMEYIPKSYKTTKGHKKLPERMRSPPPPELSEILGSMESRQVFGGDELRFWAHEAGVQKVFMDMKRLEDMRRFMGAAR
jgi:hypothetical protein